MKTLTYEEIVQQNQEGATSASAMEAQRRQERRTVTTSPDTGRAATPQEIRGCAIELASARSVLSVPAASAEALTQVDEMSDGSIDYVAPVVVGLLRDVPKVSQATGIPADAMAQVVEQRTEMTELRETTAQLRSDLTQERRKSAARVRELYRKLISQVRTQLAPGTRPRTEQDQLRSDAAEVLDLVQQIEAAPVLERERTLSQKFAHEQEMEEQERRKKLLSTMLALRSGEEVDQGAWDEAAESYDQLAGSDLQMTRRSRRR